MRIRRRHAAIFAVAALGALAAAGAALAITNNVSTVTFAVTPNTGLSKTAYKNAQINVHTHTTFAKPGDKAHGGFVHRVQLYFDNDLKFNAGAVPVCNKSLANTSEKQAMALCGKALVGKGTAQATSSTNATIKGCVLAFNGKPQNGKPTLYLHTRFVLNTCPNPSTNSGGTITALLTGVLGPANKAGFGKVLDVNNIDTQPLPLKDFVTTVKSGKYVQARCSASPLKVQTKFTYSGTGQAPDTVNSTQPCS